MNGASSNGEKPAFKAKSIPHIWQIIMQLKREGSFSLAAALRFALLKSPKFIVFVWMFWWIGKLALWQPLRKAMFSWREGLPFSYGDFMLFFFLSCVLFVCLMMTLWHFYRNECRLLTICNFGKVTKEFTFDRDNNYCFTDGSGNVHKKLFVEDYVNLYPLLRRLTEDSRESLPNVQMFNSDGSRKRAEGIMAGERQAQVYYLPHAPSQCHMIMDGRMSEYFWRKSL